ncbi:hypothetical protein M405DRAFT_831074 [Rhizopogon salebrosus TDB-379]|nr:hypothetical protein M405DRAFT_831074 [Rhizopogon salebrosus TDB-379]
MPLCVEMVRRSWWEADKARCCANKANQYPEVEAVNMILNDYQLPWRKSRSGEHVRATYH